MSHVHADARNRSRDILAPGDGDSADVNCLISSSLRPHQKATATGHRQRFNPGAPPPRGIVIRAWPMASGVSAPSPLANQRSSKGKRGTTQTRARSAHHRRMHRTRSSSASDLEQGATKTRCSSSMASTIFVSSRSRAPGPTKRRRMRAMITRILDLRADGDSGLSLAESEESPGEAPALAPEGQGRGPGSAATAQQL